MSRVKFLIDICILLSFEKHVDKRVTHVVARQGDRYQQYLFLAIHHVLCWPV